MQFAIQLTLVTVTTDVFKISLTYRLYAELPKMGMKIIYSSVHRVSNAPSKKRNYSLEINLSDISNMHPFLMSDAFSREGA